MNTTRMVISKKKANFNKVMPNELKRDTANKNANSKGEELSSCSEVWCWSKGRRKHTFRSERAAQCSMGMTGKLHHQKGKWDNINITI